VCPQRGISLQAASSLRNDWGFDVILMFLLDLFRISLTAKKKKKKKKNRASPPGGVDFSL